MKQKIILVLIIIGVIAGFIALLPIKKVSLSPGEVLAEEEKKLTHQQEVWIYALEWCESRGVKEAVNPEDKDGTPSYYSWQFKPGTFRMYAERYGLIEKGLSDSEIMEKMKDYELQREILSKMILDKAVKWENEFPDCVNRKVGRPPKG